MIRIVHLSVMRQLHKGIAVQLAIESQVAGELDGVKWETVVIHDGPAFSAHEIRTPKLFRFMFLRNIFGWIVAIRLSRQVDFLLFRHIPFDPFSSIFAPFIRNRVPIHHAKEIYELPNVSPGWRGQWAARLERYFGRFSARHALAVGAVTNEIAQFECRLHGVSRPIVIYANGIVDSQISVVADERKENTIEILFSCSTFSAWHGLDRLIEAVDKYEYSMDRRVLKIHLVGKILPEQEAAITQTQWRRKIFIPHGTMDAQICKQSLMPKCHLGLASLAMDRQDLLEGSTLKVREMLAAGLPVYSTHIDASLNDDFPFYHRDVRVSLHNLLNFADTMRTYNREEVSKASVALVSKKASIERVVRTLTQYFG
jgi:glycosyltransferase involved in cell wall biosynthesis